VNPVKCAACKDVGVINISRPVTVTRNDEGDTLTFHKQMPCQSCMAGANEMLKAFADIEEHEAKAGAPKAKEERA
jgi:hypothetical protein